MEPARATPCCDIVIPIWNQLGRTRRCLESIARATPEPVRLLLVDNGSEPATRTYLEQVARTVPWPAQLIRHPQNLGFIQAVNRGAKAGDAPWLCILNNDTVVTTGWLTELLRVAAADDRIGLLNPTSNSLGFSLGQLNPEAFARQLAGESGRSVEIPTALGFCLLVRRALWERLGGFDEGFGMGYFEDEDLSRRVQADGLRCARACAAYVYHEERVSFRRLPKAEAAYRQNRRRFVARWGRHLRLLWGPPDGSLKAGAVPLDVVRQLSREGHWVTVVGLDGVASPELASIPQVRVDAVPAAAWRLRATLRLLLKRKKPYDLVISHDPRWSRWLHRLRGGHRADILDAPSPEALLARCKALARRPS